MKFRETQLPGVFAIDPEPIYDERGFFARTWCRKEFVEHGLAPELQQCNISFNTKKGTLRGLHYQVEPFAEDKLVRCTQGAVYDVVLDLRRESATFKKWIGVELNAENRTMVYVPKGCAHGFLTLVSDTEVFYQMSQVYNAVAARGVRWNDSSFQITWPEKVQVISERDRTYPDFE